MVPMARPSQLLSRPPSRYRLPSQLPSPLATFGGTVHFSCIALAIVFNGAVTSAATVRLHLLRLAASRVTSASQLPSQLCSPSYTSLPAICITTHDGISLSSLSCCSLNHLQLPSQLPFRLPSQSRLPSRLPCKLPSLLAGATVAATLTTVPGTVNGTTYITTAGGDIRMGNMTFGTSNELWRWICHSAIVYVMRICTTAGIATDAAFCAALPAVASRTASGATPCVTAFCDTSCAAADAAFCAALPALPSDVASRIASSAARCVTAFCDNSCAAACAASCATHCHFSGVRGDTANAFLDQLNFPRRRLPSTTYFASAPGGTIVSDTLYSVTAAATTWRWCYAKPFGASGVLLCNAGRQRLPPLDASEALSSFSRLLLSYSSAALQLLLSCSSAAAQLLLSCCSAAPQLLLSCSSAAPQLLLSFLSCSSAAPQLLLSCCSAAPQLLFMLFRRSSAAPQLLLCCSSAALQPLLGCSSAAPQMLLGCSSAAPQLRHSCSSMAPCCRLACPARRGRRSTVLSVVLLASCCHILALLTAVSLTPLPPSSW